MSDALLPVCILLLSLYYVTLWFVLGYLYPHPVRGAEMSTESYGEIEDDEQTAPDSPGILGDYERTVHALLAAIDRQEAERVKGGDPHLGDSERRVSTP